MSTVTAVKERPILFSGEMVKAILDGRKTQTRRVVKPQPFLDDDGLWKVRQGSSSFVGGLREHVKTGERVPYTLAETITTFCKSYGNPGDRLWVRETWGIQGFVSVPEKPSRQSQVIYRADGGNCLGWKPSIHMKREHSRITLEITDVRVERLQDVSDADCYAEGLPDDCSEFDDAELAAGAGLTIAAGSSERHWYAGLWNKINGPGSWDANPFVWAITFKRIEA